jgi:hypothetical protein
MLRPACGCRHRQERHTSRGFDAVNDQQIAKLVGPVLVILLASSFSNWGVAFIGLGVVLGMSVAIAVVQVLWKRHAPEPTPQADPDPVIDPAFLERVRFDSRGLTLQGRHGGRWIWLDTLGNILTLTDICSRRLGPVEPGEDAIVEYCRDNIRFGWSLVEARSIRRHSLDGFVCVYKHEHRPSYDYAGRLHVLLAGHTIVFWMGARERGVTGGRDAAVTVEGLRAGTLLPGTAGTRLEGWFKDPYDRRYDDRTVCSIADDRQYDARFPDHPLSRIRQTLGQIEATFTIALDGSAPPGHSAFLSPDPRGSSGGPAPTVH